MKPARYGFLFDPPPFGGRRKKTLSPPVRLRSLYEEVSGYGFYSKAPEAEYAARAGRHEPPNA